jgi:hypothetical protein
MNDASEFVYSKEILKECLRDMSISIDDIDFSVIDIICKRLYLTEIPRAFTVSFTSKCDATTHWQAYADKSGFALHFDRNQLIAQARLHGYFTGSCIYDKEEQKNIAKKAFKEILNICRKVSKECNENSMDSKWVAEAILYYLGRLSPLFKSNDFCHEDEWRCWTYLPWGGCEDNPNLSDIEFYNKSGILTARKKLELCINNILLKITVGPSQYQDINAMTAKGLLKKHNIFCTEIVKSASPLRSLF